ncbi:glycosyltransferase family 2 protein [soil metagenome]
MVAKSLLIVTPVFNDWASFSAMLAEIDKVMPAWNMNVDLIAVDDGSSQSPQIGLAVGALSNIRDVTIVSLAANLGHQRAIATGLAHANRLAAHDLYLVMDSDGEDRPEDIATMLQMSVANPDAVVVAKRAQRSENWRFRVFYKVYKTLFRLLTGRVIDFGNFCLIPGNQLGRIAHMAELWNHFAGALVRSRIPLVSTDTIRGTRYAGRSTMNFVSLVVHGLSAISVFSDFMFVRLLVASLAVGVLPVIISAVAVILRFTTDLAIPGWTTNIAGFAALAILQILTLLVTSVFVSLSGRSGFPFVPAIHALTYIRETTCLRSSKKDPAITPMKAAN